MFPRGSVSLATLHTERLLNLVIKDKMLVVTIFDRLENSDTTEKGYRNMQALSMEKGFRKRADSDEDQDDEDCDLSYDDAEQQDDEVKILQVKKKCAKPNVEDTFALREAKQLIAELSLDPEVLSEQEAMHLSILMAATKAADIKAEGTFVPPAIVTNLLKVTNSLAGILEASKDRQSQLGFQLNENVSSTESLDNIIKRRTSKGSFLPAENSENIWKGMQVLMDRQIKQDRHIKDLGVDLKTSKTKTAEMDNLLKAKNIEVESMRMGFIGRPSLSS